MSITKKYSVTKFYLFIKKQLTNPESSVIIKGKRRIRVPAAFLVKFLNRYTLCPRERKNPYEKYTGNLWFSCIQHNNYEIASSKRDVCFFEKNNG